MTRRLWLVTGIVATCFLAPLRGVDRAPFTFSTKSHEVFTVPRVPLESVPPGLRERIQSVLDRPALSAHGPTEAFQAEGHVYRWLLDHPDLAVKLWRQI